MLLVMGILSFSITASVTFVTIIGIERFFAIKVPLQHRLWHMKRRRLVKYTILAWLFDFVLITIMELIDALVGHKYPMRKSVSSTYIIAGLLTFGLVLNLILYSSVIYLMLIRSLKLFDFDKKVLRVNPKRIKHAMKKERSSITVCILVVVSFIVCNVPIVVDLCQLRITMSSTILLKLSAVANPLIYFFKGYLERYYGKKKLVSSSNEAGAPKENGQRGGNEIVKFHEMTDRVTGCNQTINEEQNAAEVIENTAAVDNDSGGNEGRS